MYPSPSDIEQLLVSLVGCLRSLGELEGDPYGDLDRTPVSTDRLEVRRFIRGLHPELVLLLLLAESSGLARESERGESLLLVLVLITSHNRIKSQERESTSR